MAAKKAGAEYRDGGQAAVPVFRLKAAENDSTKVGGFILARFAAPFGRAKKKCDSQDLI